jgi:hypothetical protein
LPDRKARLNRIKELVLAELAAIARDWPDMSFDSNDHLARSILNRLDPHEKIPELVRVAATQQIAYELNRQDPGVRRKWHTR